MCVPLKNRTIRNRLLRLAIWVSLVGSWIGARVSSAEEFYPALTEDIPNVSTAVVGEWISDEPIDPNRGKQAKFRILRILKDGTGSLKVGTEIVGAQFPSGKPGQQFIVLASLEEGQPPFWFAFVKYAPAIYDFASGFPKKKPDDSLFHPSKEQLSYLLTFLEHPQREIAVEVYRQFRAARPADVLSLANEFPRKKLRKWVADPAISRSWLDLYALLLGACGRREDVPILEKRLPERRPDGPSRRMVNGVITGYLLLKREDGLSRVEESYIKSKTATLADIDDVMDVLLYIWTYAPEKISQDRLKEAMRLVLDHPRRERNAIFQLAAWKDWSVQDRLVTMYGEIGKRDAVPFDIRRAIILYMLACERDMPESVPDTPLHVQQARAFLQKLQKKDPESIKNATKPPLH